MSLPRVSFFALMLVLVLGVGVAIAPAQQTAPLGIVKIGVLTPITGAGAPTGAWAKLGSEIAVEIINNSYPDLDLPLATTFGLPNLQDARVQLVFGDHEARPEKGIAEAERLITQEKVAAVTGVGFSGVAAAIQPTVERYGVPWVEGMASSPSLTKDDTFKWFFRVTPHDQEYSQGMFDFLKDLAKRGVPVKRIGLLYEDTIFGKDSATAQKRFAKEAGFEIVVDVQYRRDTADYTGEIQRLKAAKPDVILPSSYANDAILILKTMKQLNYSPPIILAQNSGYVDANFTKAVGADADGILSRASWAADLKKPQISKVIEITRKLTNRQDVEDLLASPVAGQVTAVLTIADAINRAGSIDPRKVREALMATITPGSRTIMPWPKIEFDPVTRQNKFAYAMMIQRQKGSWWTVWPFLQASKSLIYPFPSWSTR